MHFTKFHISKKKKKKKKEKIRNWSLLMKIISTVHKLLFFKTTICIPWKKRFEKAFEPHESKKNL